MSPSLFAKVAHLLIALLCFMISQRAFAQTAIIDKGVAKATIFVQAKAPSTVQHAAGDLQEYLKQITDVEIPISTDPTKLNGFVIYVGDTDMARKQGIHVDMLPPDGFRIVSNKNWMVIAGKDYDGPPLGGFQDPFLVSQTYNTELKMGMFGNAGTMFGVNHFLEQYCGIRWYMPGDLGTVVPRKKTITVPVLNIRKAPYYQQRHAFYAYVDWFKDDMLWYRRAGYGSPAPVQINHSFVPLFGKYKETHPEYFAIIGGKRDFTNLSTEEGGGNLNLSDPGLIQQAITDANKYFDDNPDQTIFPLCPPDGMTKISEDPVSQAQIDLSQGPGGEFSNYVWGFINKVAKGIQKQHPDKFIGGFAYERYSKPPTNIDKLEPNVVLVITKFRAQYPNPVVKKSTDERIAAWSKKVKVIYAWEYYCNSLYNRAWRGFPMSFPKLIQDDLKALKGISRGEFIEAESWANANPGRERDDIRMKFRGMQHLLMYTTARLLWDPDMDLNAMLTEYYKLFYGPAETPMRGFWEKVESNWYQKGWQMSPYQVYDSTTINQLLEFLKQAQAKTAPKSVYRERLDLLLHEFAPTAQIAVKQATLPRPTAEVPALETQPLLNADVALPPLYAGAPLEPFLDRNFNNASAGTNVQVAWDSKNLYVDLRCYEPKMDKLKILATKRDSSLPGVWDDDCVELFISPDAAHPEKTFHYIVNAGGVLFDARINKVGDPEDVVWDGSARIVVRKEDKRWIARLAIPWADLGVDKPEVGRKMAANFCRTRHAAGEYLESGWAPVKHTAYYTPEDFGTLTLGPQAAEAAPLANPASIKPATVKDWGSGASTVDLYYAGGVPDLGLFVGQANPYIRNDRVLCTFDLVPLLETGQKIEKVELTFGVSYVTGKKTKRDVSLSVFPYTVKTLDAQALGTGDPEPVKTITVAQETSYSEAVDKAAYAPEKVDVTALVKEAVATGRTSLTFRWQDETAEKEGNPDLTATGCVLSGPASGGLPALNVTLKN